MDTELDNVSLNLQQTPNPAAQLPSEVPPLVVHSDAV